MGQNFLGDPYFNSTAVPFDNGSYISDQAIVQKLGNSSKMNTMLEVYCEKYDSGWKVWSDSPKLIK